jgi:hypothetical protein
MHCHGKVFIRRSGGAASVAGLPGSWGAFNWPHWNWHGVLALNETAASCVGFGTALTGKSRPRLCGRLLEVDGVAEAFELGDEALGGLFGVAAGEVVAAEVVVDLAGGEHVPDGDDDRVLAEPSAFLWPRRGRSRVYWAAR